MSIVKPTVGRNLYFQPGPGDNEITQHPPRDGELAAQPLHAHILYVHNDQHVTLEVVDHIGNRHVRGDVMLVQGDIPSDYAPGSEYCYWMPIQRTAEYNQRGAGSAGPVGGTSGAGLQAQTSTSGVTGTGVSCVGAGGAGASGAGASTTEGRTS